MSLIGIERITPHRERRDLKSHILLVVIAVLIVSGVAGTVFLTTQSSIPKQVEITGTVTLPPGDRLQGVGFIDVIINCNYPPCRWLSNTGLNNTYSITIPNGQNYTLDVAFDTGPKTNFLYAGADYLNVSTTSSTMIHNITCTFNANNVPICT